MQRLASNLGFSVGPAAGGFLASRHFWLLFVVVALTTLIAAIALLWFFRLRRIEGATDENVNVEVRTSPLLDKTFVYFLALMLMSMLVFFQFLPTYPLYLQDHYGLSTELIGLMFAINTVVIVVFEMLLVDHVKHWPLLPTIGWGSFLTCVGFGIFPFGTSIAFGALAMLVVTGERNALGTIGSKFRSQPKSSWARRFLHGLVHDDPLDRLGARPDSRVGHLLNQPRGGMVYQPGYRRCGAGRILCDGRGRQRNG